MSYFNIVTTPGTMADHALLGVPGQRPSVFRNLTSKTLAGEDDKFFDEHDNEAPAGAETVAFAFDIDGVLLRGKEPIPGARETIQLLQKKNIPFIFLTNGGGKTEEKHVEQLGQRLNVELTAANFVQSHTPFYDLVPKYKDETILVLGGHGDQIRDLAHAYGFSKVITSSDLVAEWPHIHPFPEMTQEHHSSHGRRTGTTPKVAAILVWSSPRDWCLDLQIVTDLLLGSHGNPGKKSAFNNLDHLPNYGFLNENQPHLFFCNPDFEWKTQHEHPRFAQGAFRAALKGIWASATQGRAELKYTVIGKPTKATYTYGEKVLTTYNDTLNAELGRERKITKVYMIGDNPESDIRGANEFDSHMGAEWRSVLVETGVHEAGTKPTYEPTFYARDVKSAVMKVLAEENPDALDDLDFQLACLGFTKGEEDGTDSN
ncbi:hypothetical protein PFICI_06777 [Pestalotiopsis fici W106-1]|uniref:Uncharacterized protein n=1 Tax=Pestalotiopsis fici (strain W106-1 / CGMCC3.15140) TaxID=1229662 RepID=W3X6V3_PESFW|nr:uncharacterized protein PFICI_06777 [Pestalotiopsis fici W106-1]ETS81775.1 hypothetical protein PFICI_06777 [Pestalotiopsis fici W106-1]